VKDWFRRSTWSDNDRDEFETRLRRARPTGRAQYLRIQAFHLADAGRDDLLSPALELLRRLLAEYPESGEVAAAEHLRAKCHERMGDTLLAVEAYRAAMEAERRRPTIRTDAALDFALFVSRRSLASLFAEVSSILDEHVDDLRPFPIQRFKFHAARALLAVSREPEKARNDAALALKEAAATDSGFRYHPQVGLVGDTDETVRQRLERLAAG
jgi:hypothetical protein